MSRLILEKKGPAPHAGGGQSGLAPPMSRPHDDDVIGIHDFIPSRELVKFTQG